MRLETVTPQEVSDFDIDDATPKELATYFHIRALSSKEERVEMRRLAGVDLNQGEDMGNALLAAFPDIFGAWERATSFSSAHIVAEMIREFVRSYTRIFAPAPQYYAFAIDTIREWHGEWKAKTEEAEIFNVEFVTDGEA